MRAGFLATTLVLAAVGCCSNRPSRATASANIAPRGKVLLIKPPTKDPSGFTGKTPRMSFIGAPDGGLAEAIVHILNPPTNVVAPAVPERLLVISNGVAIPRTLAVRVGQPVRLRLEGTRMMNVMSASTAGNSFNIAMPRSGGEHVHRFSHPELPVRLTDNVITSFAAYLGVFGHSWFAVTDREGRFELPELPPGDYTIEVYHPGAGRSQATVHVPLAASEVRLELKDPRWQ